MEEISHFEPVDNIESIIVTAPTSLVFTTLYARQIVMGLRSATEMAMRTTHVNTGANVDFMLSMEVPHFIDALQHMLTLIGSDMTTAGL